MAKANGQSLATRGRSRTGEKQPTREEIQMRAYQIYLERGGSPGDPLGDWVRAERELLHKNGKAKRSTKTTTA